MKKYLVTTTATWTCEVEAEDEDEAMDNMDVDTYDNYQSDFTVEEI